MTEGRKRKGDRSPDYEIEKVTKYRCRGLTQIGWKDNEKIIVSVSNISLSICNPQERIVKIINKPGVSCVG